MKVALCLYGLVGSKLDKNGVGESLDPKIAYDLYKKNIIDVNDEVDVFIHSWSKDAEKKLIDLYNPKLSVIENQKVFNESDNHPDIKGFLLKKRNLFNRIFKPNQYQVDYDAKLKESRRAYSRWYSNREVLSLKKQYEMDNNIIYDCVIVTRLDVGFFVEVDFSKYNMCNFYASNWNDPPTERNNFVANKANHNEGKGFLDFWFFSNSEKMDKFGGLYNRITDYDVCPHLSSWQHVSSFTDSIEYTMYRWTDHEMIRRKYFNSNK